MLTDGVNDEHWGLLCGADLDVVARRVIAWGSHLQQRLGFCGQQKQRPDSESEVGRAGGHPEQRYVHRRGMGKFEEH
jgi:hypothetical protein